MLIEVPIAILANCGRTDDGQRAMTKDHLTFDRLSLLAIYLKLKDVSFFYVKQRIF